MRTISNAGTYLSRRYTSLGRFMLDLVLLAYFLALPLIFLSPVTAVFLVIPLVFLILSGVKGPAKYD